jgi:proline dehydrogenase
MTGLRPLARRAAFGLATSDRVESVVLATAEPRRFAFRRALRYVAGIDENAAFATVERLRVQGLLASIDLFGEDNDDPAVADDATGHYVALATRLAAHPNTYLSVDSSHLGLDRDAVGCRARIERIARALPAGARLQLGAEQTARTDATIALAIALAGLPVMATVQANLRRSERDIEDLADAGVPIRLVKGAYVEPGEIAHPWGAPTDGAYVALAERLRDRGADHALATHDPTILERLLADRHPASVEFLLGVRPEEGARLAGLGHRVRIYVPFGTRWFRYYTRRLAESIGA